MFSTIADVRAANKAAGRCWFDPGSMRFFRSRTGRTVYGGRYFISSEQFKPESPRRYTIREVSADGEVDTVGEFMAYATNAAARAEIRELLLKKEG